MKIPHPHRRTYAGDSQAALSNCDHLFSLLDEIAAMVGRGERKGLRAKCVAALRLWIPHQRIMRRAMTAVERSRRTPFEKAIKLILDAGAKGLGPRAIQKLLEGLDLAGLHRAVVRREMTRWGYEPIEGLVRAAQKLEAAGNLEAAARCHMRLLELAYAKPRPVGDGNE